MVLDYSTDVRIVPEVISNFLLCINATSVH